MCSPSIFQQDLSCSSPQLETSPLLHSLSYTRTLLCRVLYECRTKSACPTLISPPGSRLFHQVDQTCAVKENALSGIPILLTGTARRYEENEVGVLDRHGCPSSMFRWTQVDVRNKLCLHLCCSDCPSGLLGDSRSFLFSDAQLMTRGYGADGLTWWCR